MKKQRECGIRKTPLTDPGLCTSSVNIVGLRDRDNKSLGCGIVVKKELDPGVCTYSVTSVLSVHMKAIWTATSPLFFTF